ncbi:MAG: glucosaminidase, partial [Parashewanella sp.]
MKQGRIGKLTIALGLVIIIIYGLRVYLLPNQIGPEQEVGLIKKNPVPLNKPTSSKLPDFVNMQNVVLKKQAFFSFLRPLVELQNLQIKKERAFLI